MFCGCSDLANGFQCFRVGEGFNPANKYNNFWIDTLNVDDAVNETAVDVFFSDSATFYNSDTDFGSGIANCLDPEKAPTCDWDKIFSTPVPEDIQNTTKNVAVVSYSFYDTNKTSKATTPSSARVYCDTVSYMGFPTYTIDTLPYANPINLVKIVGLTDKKLGAPVVIDPAWSLAAWSVDKNGTVPHSRAIAQVMQTILPEAWASKGSPDDYFFQTLLWLHVYSLTQTMSLIPFESRNLTLPSLSSSDKKSPNPTSQPVLHTWATRHVWAYGIGESRTSKLGIAVICLGVICVLIRLILGLGLGKREHSPVELFVAALEHHPTGEFEGLKDEGGMAKVRYMMEEDEEGRPRFVPERSYTGDFGGRRTWSWKKDPSGGGQSQGFFVGSPPAYEMR